MMVIKQLLLHLTSNCASPAALPEGIKLPPASMAEKEDSEAKLKSLACLNETLLDIMSPKTENLSKITFTQLKKNVPTSFGYRWYASRHFLSSTDYWISARFFTPSHYYVFLICFRQNTCQQLVAWPPVLLTALPTQMLCHLCCEDAGQNTTGVLCKPVICGPLCSCVIWRET